MLECDSCLRSFKNRVGYTNHLRRKCGFVCEDTSRCRKPYYDVSNGINLNCIDSIRLRLKWCELCEKESILRKKNDPNKLTTNNVQVWSKSGLMMGVIPKEQAIEMLNDTEKRVFIITGQAIGWY